MALIEEVFVGNRLIPIDQAQDEINKLEAAIAEQNRILNHLTTETSLSTNKALRQEIAQSKELIEAIASVLRLLDGDDIIRQIKAERQAKECAMLAAKGRGASLDAIAEMLGIKFTGNTDDIYEAIASLKKSAHREDYWRKKCTEIDQNCDRDELQSERDHYRGILDKLCDRLNAADIEGLEHIAKHQEMSLDFIDQHNDDLREKLTESQALLLKYLNRIVELENEVRSRFPKSGQSDHDDSVDSPRYTIYSL